MPNRREEKPLEALEEKLKTFNPEKKEDCFALALLHYRVAKNCSKRKLGEKLGVSYGIIRRWEYGVSFPSIPVLESVIQKLS